MLLTADDASERLRDAEEEDDDDDDDDDDGEEEEEEIFTLHLPLISLTFYPWLSFVLSITLTLHVVWTAVDASERLYDAESLIALPLLSSLCLPLFPSLLPLRSFCVGLFPFLTCTQTLNVLLTAVDQSERLYDVESINSHHTLPSPPPALQQQEPLPKSKKVRIDE